MTNPPSFHENYDRQDIKGGTERSFGFVFAVVFLAIGLSPLLSAGGVRIWPVVIAAVFGVVALVSPGLLRPLNTLWLKFGLLLSRIFNPIVLGFLFYVVITPAGLIMRLLGKDPLRLRIDRTAQSYWIERRPPGPPPESMRNQF